MFPLHLYARVRISLCINAHETAGAARTRSSLRPLVSRGPTKFVSLGQKCVARTRTYVSSSLRTQGPITPGIGWKRRASAAFSKKRRHGVWVPAFAGTTGCESAFSRHTLPEVFQIVRALFKQRAQGRPGARCTRGLVCIDAQEMRTRAYR